MELYFEILFLIVFTSGVIRHVIRTFGYISELSEKALNRRLEKFKH